MTLLINAIVILFANCSRGLNEDFIEVIIDNRLDESLFFGDINLHVVSCEENEKMYFLSTPIFADERSIRINGPFNIDNEVIANTRCSIKIRKFFVSGEKYNYLIGQDGELTRNTIDNYYSDSNITFPIYFLSRSKMAKTYDEYKTIIKDNGFIAKGYMNEENIIFIINEKIKVASTNK
jgi:hypothetical protein